MNLYNILWILIGAITAAMPVIFIEFYIKKKNIIWIALAILSYFLLIISYIVILPSNNIIIIYPLLKILSIIIVVLCGFFLFSKKLSIKGLIGILFGIISIYLLSTHE
jgi:multidrug transporter EmrE-like cation transporter